MNLAFPAARDAARRGVSPRPSWLLPVTVALWLALAPTGARVANAQFSIGYDPLADLGNLNSSRTFSVGTPEALVVGFQFNVTEPVALSNVRLLLSGDADVANFSLLITETLPVDLTAPVAIATLSATGTLTSSPTAVTFSSLAPVTFAPATPYYLRIAYQGTSQANWVRTSVAAGGSGGGGGDTGSGGSTGTGSDTGSGSATGSGSGGNTGSDAGGTPGLTLVTTPLQAGDFVTGRLLFSGGYDESSVYVQGFSVTVSAVPEPGVTMGIAFTLTLLAAMGVRVLRHRRTR